MLSGCSLLKLEFTLQTPVPYFVLKRKIAHFSGNVSRLNTPSPKSTIKRHFWSNLCYLSIKLYAAELYSIYKYEEM
jgi:hypothetical protein